MVQPGHQQSTARVQSPGKRGQPFPPPDWASLSASGAVAASPPPSGVPPSYGLDAQRLPVWFAADCVTEGRSLSADSWPIIAGLAASGSYLAYSLTGAVQEPYSNDLGLVAAAASAMAAGEDRQGQALLAQARSGQNGQTYYGDAWVALGSVLLTTLAVALPARPDVVRGPGPRRPCHPDASRGARSGGPVPAAAWRKRRDRPGTRIHPADPFVTVNYGMIAVVATSCLGGPDRPRRVPQRAHLPAGRSGSANHRQQVRNSRGLGKWSSSPDETVTPAG